MPSSTSRPSMLSNMPRAGTATKWLVGLLIVVSVAAKMAERKFGFGAQDLVFQTDAVLHGQVWRLATHMFVKDTVWGLLLSALVLWMFGGWYESSWGTRDYVRFFFLSSIGAALLAIPLSFLVNAVMPFQDLGLASGPDAAITAMMVALALSAPNSNVMFGFVLPMPAKTMVYLLLGIDVLSGLMNGASTLSVTLGGMAMGYLLVTGAWRPTRLMNRLKLWRLRKRRDGLYVVPPRDKHTLN